jgi:hypothetical protein
VLHGRRRKWHKVRGGGNTIVVAVGSIDAGCDDLKQWAMSEENETGGVREKCKQSLGHPILTSFRCMPFATKNNLSILGVHSRRLTRRADNGPQILHYKT